MKKFIPLLIIPLLIIPLLIIPLGISAEEIVDGDLIRAIDGIDVYIVKLIGAKKFKRLILNPEIFNQYGHLKWENIKNVEQSVIDTYSTSNLVRAVDDEKVYALYPDQDTGEKRWIKTVDDFLDLGYDWDAVYEINSFERDYYSLGEELVADTGEPAPSSDGGEQPEPTRDPITINVPDDYSTIQGAIDFAINGDTILVAFGTYNENIIINKNIKLISDYAVSAIIDGQGNGPAISIQVASDFLIQRFTLKSESEKIIYCSGTSPSKGTIKNTILKDSDYGIFVQGNCDLAILNNIIYNNHNSANDGGAGILIRDNNSYNFTLEIRNNTIDDNYHGIWSENANLKVINNIITNNAGGNDSSGIYHSGEGESDNLYNDVWNNGFDYNGDALPGNGSIGEYPRFVNRDQRDYRLVSGTTNYSLCIDTGHPDYIYNDGAFLSGNYNYRNDMGAYGGPDNKGW